MSLKAYTYTLFIVPQRTSVGESLSRGVLSYYLLGYRKLILSRVLFLPYFPIVLLSDEPSDAGDIVGKVGNLSLKSWPEWPRWGF